MSLRSSSFACTLITLGALAACGGESAPTLGVQVAFDDDVPTATRNAAVRVEAYLVEQCDVVSMGDRPADAIAGAHALRDAGAGPLFGQIATGDYGLYAVAQDMNCAVVAAGCAPVTIGQETEGALSVSLSAFSGAGCSGDQQCVIDTGDCSTDVDGGTIVNSCDSEPDLVRCRSRGRIGLCRSGECCTGCWDGSACQEGDENVGCGADGEDCKVCDSVSEICDEGACTAVSFFTDPIAEP